MARRTFTPVQANRTLPLVRRIVSDLLDRGRELRKIGGKQGDPVVRARVGTLEAEVRDLAEELERVGCSYKDWGFDKGLVDFPAEIEGVKVLLCWRSDEESVTWYHTPEAGFAGRTPIPHDLLTEDAPATR